MTGKVEQEVCTYSHISEAQHDMQWHINRGWRVVTCAMSSLSVMHGVQDRIMVVYERSVSDG